MSLAELDTALRASPSPVRIWWRDDDTGDADPRLDRLLGIAERRRAPLALAVIPAALSEAGRDAVLACSRTTVLQHGIAHRQNGRPGEKKIELGGAAGPNALRRGLERGREQLERAFGGRFLPVLVPPWNRIDPRLIDDLPGLGFRGLSLFGGPALTAPLRRVDTHVDLVRWREGRRHLGLDETAAALASHIRRRPEEPCGLLSHHLAMESADLAAVDRLLAVLQDHSNAGVAAAAELFSEV